MGVFLLYLALDYCRPRQTLTAALLQVDLKI